MQPSLVPAEADLPSLVLRDGDTTVVEGLLVHDGPAVGVLLTASELTSFEVPLDLAGVVPLTEAPSRWAEWLGCDVRVLGRWDAGRVRVEQLGPIASTAAEHADQADEGPALLPSGVRVPAVEELSASGDLLWLGTRGGSSAPLEAVAANPARVEAEIGHLAGRHLVVRKSAWSRQALDDLQACLAADPLLLDLGEELSADHQVRVTATLVRLSGRTATALGALRRDALRLHLRMVPQR